MEKWISKSIFYFSILIIKWKNQKQKKFFLSIYFYLKSISKNRNHNFQIHFLFWNQEINFKKFFRFSILVIELKTEKWKNSKFVLFLNQKTNYTFGARIHGSKGHSIFVLKRNGILNFSRLSFSLSNRKMNFKS